MTLKTFIIAEAGVNHNGDIGLAHKLIDSASDAGVDAVKFQTFKTEALVCGNTQKAKYQQITTDCSKSQFDMLKNLELAHELHQDLMDHCSEKGVRFLSSPFDIESAEFLLGLGLEIYKIPSGEITNLPYLRKIGSFGKKVILSTGMSDLGEIEDALDILTSSGTELDDISVLHCNTEYPTPFEDVNLRAMQTIRKAFGVNVGYSDHTPGIEVPIAAVAMGAGVIEKHFTLDKHMDGPDHRASIEPVELKEIVKAIRNIEKALGSGRKRPSPSEMKNLPIVRKSIVARHPIKRGEIFTEQNLAVKRPGHGVSPMRWDELIGKNARKDFDKDEMIEL